MAPAGGRGRAVLILKDDDGEIIRDEAMQVRMMMEVAGMSEQDAIRSYRMSIGELPYSDVINEDRLHLIRLPGPWQVRVVQQTAGSADLPKAFSCRVPGDWTEPLGHEFRGSVRAERRFNRPTGLEPGQPVYLVVEQVDFRGKVTLNDRPLGPVGLDHELRHEITELLIDQNRLSIEVELPLNCQRPGRESRGGGLLGEVRLEIVY